MSKPRMPLIIVLLLAVVAGAVFGGMRLVKGMGIASNAGAEAKAEEAERKQCQEQLALLYKGWKQYRADHKGAEPPSIEAMIPKYIAKVELLECPTAVRLEKQHIHLDQGGFELNRRNVVVTYGFRWLTAGFPMQVKKQGDQVPLIICKSHQQAMYWKAYSKPPREGSFDDEERAKLTPEVASAPILGVRRNGKVEALSLSTDR